MELKLDFDNVKQLFYFKFAVFKCFATVVSVQGDTNWSSIANLITYIMERRCIYYSAADKEGLSFVQQTTRSYGDSLVAAMTKEFQKFIYTITFALSLILSLDNTN